MNDENELLEPLATEAGQLAIVRAIRDISSLEYAVRAEQAASLASAKAGEASQSAIEASESKDNAKDWATKTDGYVEQETITIPPEQEGEEPTTETINLYSARYYAALALDIYNNMSFDSVPTENSTNMVNSGVVYSALDLKADKSDTYTKSEVDTAIGNVQSSLIFDNLPTQNSNNLVKSGGIYTALDEKADKSTTYTKTETDALISTAVSNLVNSAPSTLDTLEELADALGDDPNFATTIATQLGNKADKSMTYTKTEVDTALNAKADLSTTYTKTEVDTALSNVQSTLTFDNAPTANSDNPVKSSGIKTALDGKQDTLTFDSTPTANSTNPVTSGAVYDALLNIPSGGGSGGSITIDSVPTENSLNAVSSGGVYDALLNLPSGNGRVYTLTTSSYLKTFTCDSEYENNVNSTQEHIMTCSDGATTREFRKDNSIHAICGIANINNVAKVVLVSLDPSGVSGYTCYRQNGGVTGTFSSQGDFYDSEEDCTWYYCVAGTWEYRRLTVSNFPLIGLFADDLSAAQAILSLSNYSILSGFVLENLFNPTNYIVTNNNTISDNTLKSLIVGYRPIKINNETYYFVKLDNGTYYYENPNNTITIDSSWVVTITTKSSSGSSVTVDSTITLNSTNPVESLAIFTALSNKADQSTTYTKTEVDTALGNKQGTLTFDTAPTSGSSNPVTSDGVYTALSSKGDVTTNTDQNITSTKTFVGSKKIAFKQSGSNDKLGFTLYSNSNAERGYLEFNPTNTVDGVTGLMTLGNYATSSAALTQVGFRRYSNISGASGAYNLLMPMVADARTPFSLTTTYQNFYLPLGFTDGTTTVKTAKSGVVDLSPLLASLEVRIAALEGN